MFTLRSAAVVYTLLLTALTVLAHMVGELRDVELAEDLERALRPYEDRWVVLGAGSATLGPVDWCLGAAGLVRGDGEQAIRDFERGLEHSRTLGSRPYEAHCLLGIALALRLRHENGDEARAAELQEQATAIGEELGMARLLRDAAAASPA